jgi:hypothetical protein
MENIILTKKYSEGCSFWENLVRKKQIDNLSVDQVLNKYQGFEGELVSSFPIKDISNDIFEKVFKSNNFSLLYIISNEKPMPIFIKNQFIQTGYDFGICEEDASIYSSIFNEILFGNVDHLISWKNKLNDHFLFETNVLVENYASLHRQLLQEGKDVEDHSEMRIYEIWKYNSMA